MHHSLMGLVVILDGQDGQYRAEEPTLYGVCYINLLGGPFRCRPYIGVPPIDAAVAAAKTAPERIILPIHTMYKNNLVTDPGCEDQ